MFKLIFLIVCFFNLILSETNVTCSDNRICFTYEKYEEHCEIFTDCDAPCNFTNCSIRVENDVECDHYVCFNVPVPDPKQVSIGLDFLYGSIGSISTSLTMLIFWLSFKKLLLRWRRRNHTRIFDDITINEQETSRVIEGDASSRPIIISHRELQVQELQVQDLQVPEDPQIIKDLSVRPKEKKERVEASCSTQVIVEDATSIRSKRKDTNMSFENPFCNIKPNFRPIFEESDPRPVHDKFDSKPPSMESIVEETPESF